MVPSVAGLVPGGTFWFFAVRGDWRSDNYDRYDVLKAKSYDGDVRQEVIGRVGAKRESLYRRDRVLGGVVVI